jgi:hypothetical protein
MRARATIALLGLALALGAGCGAIEGRPASSSPPGGNNPNNPGPNGGPPGGSGPGGGNSNPPSGSPGGPANPGTPPPVIGADAGAGGSGPPAADPQAPCTVTLVPVAPPRLLDLLAGPNARLRLQATVSGPSAPAQPTFTWKALLDDAAPIETTKVGAGDTAEVPLRSPGRYRVEVSVTPTCGAAVTATASIPDLRTVTYWVRITPPKDKGPTQEMPIQVGGSNKLTKDIVLQRGYQVSIDPKDADGVAIPSFIRVSSRQSSVRFEWNNDSTRKFLADLDHRHLYDVLVVPSRAGYAPALIGGRSPSELRAENFMLDAGVTVRGTVRAGPTPGAPLPGARVLLRAGALPSTIGTSGADGGFELRARAASFEAVVLPPPDSGLPEARLPAGELLSIGPAGVVGFR